jgi:hypothetical protein
LEVENKSGINLFPKGAPNGPGQLETIFPSSFLLFSSVALVSSERKGEPKKAMYL